MKRDLLKPIKSSFLLACLAAGMGAYAQPAPVAQSATNILNGSAVANWTSVAGATDYRIDVSTQPNFEAGVPTPWINEFRHKQDAAGDFVEIVVPNNYSSGTDLKISLYNASGTVYATSLSAAWTQGPNAPAGHKVRYTTGLDLQLFGGAFKGGIALSHTVNNVETLIQFISYGGPIQANGGPAAGATSQPVATSSIATESARLAGTGGRYQDFIWETGTASRGTRNNNQSLTPALTYAAFVQPYENYSAGTETSLLLDGLTAGRRYYYRVRAVVGQNTSPNSNTVTFITTAPKIWTNNAWTLNGNSTSAPTINQDAMLEDDFEFSPSGDGTFSARSLTILSGSLTIKSGQTLTVRRGITNLMTEAEFVVENNANIIQENGEFANTGDVTVKKNSSPLFKYDYTIWSSPVVGQNLQAFSPVTHSDRFYTYDTTNDEYVRIPATGDFMPGHGYLIRMPHTAPNVPGYDTETAPMVYNGEFKGVLNNGTVVVPANNTGGRVHMVGNPYASPINIQAFFEANTLNLQQGTPIWIWRKRNNPDASTYATITLAGYTANYAEGGDESDGQFNTDSEGWVLNPGQGFFVQTNENAQGIVFANTMRRDVNNNQFFRNDNDNNNAPVVSRLRLGIQGEGEYHSAQAIIAYSDVTTNGIDFAWDGLMTPSGKVKMYTSVEDMNLAIQARASFTSTDIVPLKIDVTNAGSYTIDINQKTGVFEADQDVLLRDNLLNVVHNLTETPYTFVSDAGLFETRFDVMYESNGLGTNNPVADVNSVIVFTKDNAININSGLIEMSGVKVFDMRGRTLYDNQAVNGTELSINSVSASQQVLLVQITTPANGTVTKKIIF